MGQLISLSIDISKATEAKIYAGKNGARYLKLTVSLNDQVDKYGNNVSCYEAQTKEERDAKAGKNFLGNGKVVWSNGSVPQVPPKEDPF